MTQLDCILVGKIIRGYDDALGQIVYAREHDGDVMLGILWQGGAVTEQHAIGTVFRLKDTTAEDAEEVTWPPKLGA